MSQNSKFLGRLLSAGLLLSVFGLATQSAIAGGGKSGSGSKTPPGSHCPDRIKHVTGEPTDPFDRSDSSSNGGSNPDSSSSDIDSGRDYGSGDNGVPNPDTAW